MLKNVSLLKPELQLWGGMECTINRIGDTYRDQLLETGHYQRPLDLELIASLNIKAMRYPILWERHEAEKDQLIDWDFATAGVKKLELLNITPIAGLLHHGSGPAFTNLLDESFSVKFSDYAGKVASQFPSLEYYTPINEPLTTARFSGLYGLWYPHCRDPLSFALMLLNQVKGIVLAMRAIREVNPQAKLIQTEDLAKVHSTDLLAYQADFENHRRWLTFDLLCGKVDAHHPLWNYFTSIGIKAEQLEFFQLNSCAPDILGLNHYVTSERFLDHRLADYPDVVYGGNGIHEYVDVEACRYHHTAGLDVLLEEVWTRYQIPLAITEAHLACTREEQMRWFKEVWDAARNATSKGMTIQAVTLWSIFGAFDWDTLGVHCNNHYESGVFDVRSSNRTTALAAMAKSLGKHGDYQHPVFNYRGWWHKKNEEPTSKNTPLLVIGDNGMFSQAFANICRFRRLHFIPLSAAEFAIDDLFKIMEAVAKYKPWGIIHTCYNKAFPDLTQHVRPLSVKDPVPGTLAAAAAAYNIPCMTFSFDDDGEVQSLNTSQNVLVIKTSATFDPWGLSDFAFEIMDALKNQRNLAVASNILFTPTYVPHLINHALDLFIDGERGIWQLSNDSTLSRFEFATALARQAGYSDRILTEVIDHAGSEPQKSHLLNSERLIHEAKMPSLEIALHDYLLELNN